MEQQIEYFCKISNDSFLQILLFLGPQDIWSVIQLSKKLLLKTEQVGRQYAIEWARKTCDSKFFADLSLTDDNTTMQKILSEFVRLTSDNLGGKTFSVARRIFGNYVSDDAILLASKHTRAFHYKIYDFICADKDFTVERKRNLIDGLLSWDAFVENAKRVNNASYRTACRKIKNGAGDEHENRLLKEELHDSVMTEARYKQMLLMVIHRALGNLEDVDASKTITMFAYIINNGCLRMFKSKFYGEVLDVIRGFKEVAKELFNRYIKKDVKQPEATVDNLHQTYESYVYLLRSPRKKFVKHDDEDTHEKIVKKSKTSPENADFYNELADALVEVSSRDKRFADGNAFTFLSAESYYDGIVEASKMFRFDHVEFDSMIKLTAFAVKYLFLMHCKMYRNRSPVKLLNESIEKTRKTVAFVLDRYEGHFSQSKKEEIKNIMDRINSLYDGIKTRALAYGETLDLYIDYVNRLSKLIYDLDSK